MLVPGRNCGHCENGGNAGGGRIVVALSLSVFISVSKNYEGVTCSIVNT